jgi:hypothetical protein
MLAQLLAKFQQHTCKSALQIRVTTNFSWPNRLSLDDSRLFNNYILCKWESVVSLGTCFSLSLSAFFSLIFSVELNILVVSTLLLFRLEKTEEWNRTCMLTQPSGWHRIRLNNCNISFPMATTRELHKSKWQKLALPIIDAKEIIYIYSWFNFRLPFWTPEFWWLLGCLSVCYQAASDMKGFGSQ